MEGARRDWLTLACAAAGLIALWFICRPYLGIVGDPQVYVGRALADLDPAGLGRELDFVHDGQSGFSIFPPLLTAAVRALGPGAAAMAVVVVGLAAWLAAAALLASRLLAGRQAWAALVCLAAFPLGYSGFEILQAGEPGATPRVFAEAAGLAALALLLDGRKLAAAALWAVAMAFHPIMALPVGAVGLVLLGLEDRRWFYLAGAGVAAAIAAAAAQLPLAGRLFQVVDPAWRAVLSARCPFLFPNLWPAISWALLACQVTTLALAWTFLAPKFRRLVLAVGAIGVAGMLLALLPPSVLMVQIQLWRAQWPAAVLAALAFAPCAAGLWRMGGAGRGALALLVLAWVGRDNLGAALFGCGGALALRFLPLPPLHRRILPPVAWALTVVFTAALLIVQIAIAVQVRQGLPPAAALSLSAVLRPGVQTIVIPAVAVLIALGAFHIEGRRSRAAFCLGALALTVVAAWTWDDRAPAVRAREAPRAGGALTAAMTPGTVQWLGDVGNVWLWARRPQWWSEAEAAGAVFDRPLALEWARRRAILVADGLIPADQGWGPAKDAASPPLIAFSLSRLRLLCALADGPDWLIAPAWRMDSGAPPPARTIWRAPVTDYQYRADQKRWTAVRDYAVFACADLRAAQPRA